MKNNERVHFSEAVREVRVKLTLSEEYPYGPVLPYDPQLLIITDRDELRAEETAAIQEFIRQVKLIKWDVRVRLHLTSLLPTRHGSVWIIITRPVSYLSTTIQTRVK